MNIFEKILKELPEPKIELIPADPKDQELENQMSALLRYQKALETTVKARSFARKFGKEIHPSKFKFHSCKGNWIIEISEEGIRFNHQDFPNVDAEGFAKAFCDILEKNYDVHFTKRKE